MKILEIENLNVFFNGKKTQTHIVQDFSLMLMQGECLCILGESGSGKSMAMKAILGLLDNNFTLTGTAKYKEGNLLTASKETLRKVRGKHISMVVQNPMTAFDSLYRIGDQISETFQDHTNWGKKKIYETSIEMLEKMHINEPQEVLRKYPHQLSGGMLQRVMIAIAMSLEPDVLIADEPTTAIDAITQYEVMKEFQKLKEKKTTMIFITHDLLVANKIADKILVMNKGKVVDRGTLAELTEHSKDEYTRLLIKQKALVMERYKDVIGGTSFDCQH